MRVLLAVLLMGCGVSAWGSTQDAVLGLWQDDRSVLLVARENNSLSMRIHAVKDPNYRQDEMPGPAGSPRRDFKNPAAALQSRPLLGLDLLVGYAWTGERWEGEIYDPESGNTYKSRMEVDNTGRLSMRGYLGVPMFGRTALFTPAGHCSETVVAMIVASGASGCGR